MNDILTAHETLIAAIAEFEQEAKTTVSDLALEGDMQRVAALASAIRALQSAREELAMAKKPLKKALDGIQAELKSHTKDHQTALRIIIHNPDRTTIVLAEKNAADTLNKFVAWAVRDGDTERKLEALVDITKGGQQLVSRRPEHDFINPKQGTAYSYQPISGTHWFLRTQTSTKDKVHQIEEIIKILGLNRRRIDIETFAK